MATCLAMPMSVEKRVKVEASVLRCSHVGCSFVADSAAKRVAHERSFNSHSDHFMQCKSSCLRCKYLLEIGEWTDLSSVGEFDWGSVQFSFDDGVATPPPLAEERVDFLSCSHAGCTWRSTAVGENNQRACVSRHEQSVYKHRKHASPTSSCICCQSLFQTGAWRVDEDGVVVDATAGRKRSLQSMSDGGSTESDDEPPRKRQRIDITESCDAAPTLTGKDDASSVELLQVLEAYAASLAVLSPEEQGARIAECRDALEATLLQLERSAERGSAWLQCHEHLLRWVPPSPKNVLYAGPLFADE